MARKKPKPIYAFHRFLEGIFSYYHDRGMPKNTAKLRMYKDSYETVYDFIKNEKDVPDHAVVASMQHASRVLNQRGYILSQELAKSTDDEDLKKEMRHIREAKESIDQFVSTYRGESYVE